MKNSKLLQVKEIVQKLEKNYDFNDFLLNYVSDDDLLACYDTQDIIDLFANANDDGDITNTEIIYYASAIEYLAENDNSLIESLWLADNMWYELKSLNSETLASILASDNNATDYWEFLTELEKEIDALD